MMRNMRDFPACVDSEDVIFVPNTDDEASFPKNDGVHKLPQPKIVGGSARCSAQLVFQCDLIKWHIKQDKSGRKEMFYLSMHSTHFIYGYMVSDILKRTIQIAREETHCHHMGYSFRLTARVFICTIPQTG